MNKKLKTTILAWGLLLPAFTFLTVFTLYPIANSFFSSFFKNDLAVVKPRFIGLANFLRLVSDPIFIKAFWNNLLVAVVTIPASIAIAVVAAVFTNSLKHGERPSKANDFFRISFFYPVILPMVAAANIWLFIYTPAYGLLGRFFPRLNILGNPGTALWAIILMLIWKQSGYLMIFYISGLQGISRELYEAARIDGAGTIRSFLHITWPLLKPTTIYVTILSLTNAYKVVDHLYIMTKGGPNNASNMLLYYTYQNGFDFWDVGYASAITVVLVSILLILTCAHFFTQDRRAFYN
ncbi:MAG: sugar ABC transporter permease [Treponema sp.]|jgi:sn-glycerol 3-phosphate transport system permease protein|nr:sugar ABC transporter permease [Treponema sp.]